MRFGYVGLGTMGGRIAARLLANGHAVTGHNRTRSKVEWLIEKGLTWADSCPSTAPSRSALSVSP